MGRGNLMDFKTIEEAGQEYAELITATRNITWTKADYVKDVFDKFGRGSLSALSQVSGETLDYLSRLNRLARQFPAEKRYPDVSVTIYLEALCWDKPQEALKMALSEGMSARKLRELRIPKEPNRVICPKCGFQINKN